MSHIMNDSFSPVRPARRPSTPVPPGLLLAAEIERRRILLLRYPWESAIALGVFAVMFLVFAAVGTLSSAQLNLFGGNLESLAVLYILWTISISSISSGASQIGTDAATGVLENLFLSTAPIVTVLQVRAMVQALHGSVLGAVLLLAFCLGTGWLPSPAVMTTLLVAGAACCATAVGLAMVFAGVALLSKRATMLAMPANFLCIVAMTAHHAPSFDRLDNPLLYLPFVAAATAVRSAVEGGRFDLMACGIGLASAVPCVLLGRLVLARCAMACRRAGTTSVY
jgi:ABC-2 type transport system permease protein